MKPEEKIIAARSFGRFIATLSILALLSWAVSYFMPIFTSRHPGVLAIWVILISEYAAVRFAIEDRVR